MSLLHCFASPPDERDLPQAFPNPFNHQPHTIAKCAAVQLQKMLTNELACAHDFSAVTGGKMFGVLVVRTRDGWSGFLAAFSGMLAGQWQLPGFVPPLFDPAARLACLSAGEAELARYAEKIAAVQQSKQRQHLQHQFNNLMQQRDDALDLLQQQHRLRKLQRHEQRKHLTDLDPDSQAQALEKLSYQSQQDKRERRQCLDHWKNKLVPIVTRLAEMDAGIEALKQTRAERSGNLQQQLFIGYMLKNSLGEQAPMTQFFAAQPPGGAGDCAAPKLLQYAHQHDMTPLALAEFWWGTSPPGGVRQHGNFYPACRGKCGPILPFMLRGLNLQASTTPGADMAEMDGLITVYEDDDLVVINKPCGLLSVPGKEVGDSVLKRLQQCYPDATGPLLVHRLDMSTSGLLIAAKHASAHKALQQQFERRQIKKRYLAVLAGCLPEHQNRGRITLPLRVDLDDRPRQMVCHTHGKSAHTSWRVIGRGKDTTRVYFYPLSGRTHQLRVHAAHLHGLNAPIVGDELYGTAGERLMLHAERLRFTQPNTGERIEVQVPTPF